MEALMKKVHVFSSGIFAVLSGFLRYPVQQELKMRDMRMGGS
jgi:hypothetical protein